MRIIRKTETQLQDFFSISVIEGDVRSLLNVLEEIQGQGRKKPSLLLIGLSHFTSMCFKQYLETEMGERARRV